MATIVWLVVIAILVGTIVFLVTELRRKFTMIGHRLIGQFGEFDEMQTISFKNSKDFDGRSAHQRVFAIRSFDGSPFTLTAYLRLGDRMMDPFLCAPSDREGMLLISLYVGDGPATIYLEPSPLTLINISSTEHDQNLFHVVEDHALPHWFQRSFFYKPMTWIANNLLGFKF
jgi:hypothetical protein